jgi:threonine dehydrogenase-like Zn-dependent dehydrogenase
MLAACLTEPQTFSLQEVLVPTPKADEVLFKVEICGLCASNLGPWKGAPRFRYPFEPGAPGHEATGVVEAVGGEVETVRPGDRIAALSLHGFAEYDLARADSVVVLPAELSDLKFLGEPLGCAVNVCRRAEVAPDAVVAFIDLLIQLVADGCSKSIAFNRRPEALESARANGAMAAFPTLDPAKGLRALRDFAGGSLCDVVFEITGTQAGLDLATELTKERGRLVIAGYHQDGKRTVNLQLWNWRGIDVINAHERDRSVKVQGVQEAVRKIVAGELRIDPLITHQLPLLEINQAFELAASRPRGFMKAIIHA